jgi:hypothetical protein
MQQFRTMIEMNFYNEIVFIFHRKAKKDNFSVQTLDSLNLISEVIKKV